MKHTNSRTRDENQLTVFTTHELMKSGTRVRNQAVVFATYERRNLRTHDNKKKDAALVFGRKSYFQKKRRLGLLATTNQTAKVKTNQ